MSQAKSKPDLIWAVEWLDGVASGAKTMSQRSLAFIEKHGGLDAVKFLAEERGVHLLQVEDDKGKNLIAAGIKPFKIVC